LTDSTKLNSSHLQNPEVLDRWDMWTNKWRYLTINASYKDRVKIVTSEVIISYNFPAFNVPAFAINHIIWPADESNGQPLSVILLNDFNLFVETNIFDNMTTFWLEFAAFILS
jgi:hypothetical protein